MSPNSQRIGFISICTLFCLLGGCSVEGESQRVDGFLGDRAARVLRSADRVEVFRIGSERGKADGGAKLAGYPLLATGQEQGRDYAAKLAGIIRDDRSYEWEMAKGCLFSPGVAYRVWSKNESVIVLICFQCDEIGVVDDESNSQKISIHAADPARPALVKLARIALPDDAEIRAIKE